MTCLYVQTESQLRKLFVEDPALMSKTLDALCKKRRTSVNESAVQRDKREALEELQLVVGIDIESLALYGVPASQVRMDTVTNHVTILPAPDLERGEKRQRDFCRLVGCSCLGSASPEVPASPRQMAPEGPMQTQP